MQEKVLFTQRRAAAAVCIVLLVLAQQVSGSNYGSYSWMWCKNSVFLKCLTFQNLSFTLKILIDQPTWGFLITLRNGKENINAMHRFKD